MTRDELFIVIAKLKKERDCQKLAVKLGFRTGKEPKDVHNEWIEKSNVGHGQMTLAQFEEKKQWLQQKLTELS